jgi:hypothetical protein
MAISILEQSPADYGSVRRYMRTQSGIQVAALGQTYGVVEHSTGGRFSADKTYHSVPSDGWLALLEGELSQGRPLVLYIADATKLEDSSGQAPRPANESFTLAHAVLAVGLLNGGNTVVIDDPWNATPGGPGRQLRMTADAFAAAWGNTRFSGGVVHSNAGWNYIGFQPASATGVPPAPTPASELITPMPAQTATPTPTPQGPPAAPTKVALQPGDGFHCGFGACLWETVLWAASPDTTSHVEIFSVAADPEGDATGTPVSCASALAFLVEWLKPTSANIDDRPPTYWFDYVVAIGTPGVTSVRFQYGGTTDYQGQHCGFYARAVNSVGASELVSAGDDPRVNG